MRAPAYRLSPPDMSPLIKICGLTRRTDVDAAMAAGADWLGFVVEAKSSRRVSVADAAALVAGVDAPTVAVVVDPDDALVDAVVAAGFSHIQLHGDEALPRVAEVARRSGLVVIKAVPVATAGDIKLATEFSGAADWLLLDAKPPAGDGQRGGHGTAFDWSLLRGAPLPKRWGLAGGLGVDNARLAVDGAAPALVDVSSGVEVSPGVKSPALMRQFVETVRG